MSPVATRSTQVEIPMEAKILDCISNSSKPLKVKNCLKKAFKTYHRDIKTAEVNLVKALLACCD
jgi:hypothetical protein